MQDVVILSAVRTPIGAFQGAFASLPAHVLGARALAGACERAGVGPDQIEQVYMGCVLTAGQGQAPARQASIGAGCPYTTGAVTLNKVCGSAMRAVMTGANDMRCDDFSLVAAGGMESMSNAPYLLAKHRTGARIGHDRMADSMYLDGLEDAYDSGRLMGAFADETARTRQITRAAQDEFALESLERARAAQANGSFEREIVPVTVAGRKTTETVSRDEQPERADPARIPTLKPAFCEDGTVTAANASSISDGAAALVLTRASIAERLGLPVIARVVAHAAHAQAPAEFTTAPVPAIRKALDRAGWSTSDIDLYEINEAFAVVALVAMHELAIPRDKLNVNGGACALGHPIGASGARLLATLLAALESRDAKRGIVSLCIGGGEGIAMAVERL
jgi:acetyl-CoA C-acetyltransferase